MIVDLHAHYPMHLDPGLRGKLFTLHLRAVLIKFASKFGNYPSVFSGPRVTLAKMEEGGVGVAYSVLYSFFDEIASKQPAPGEYAAELLQLAATVEERATVAHNPAELRAADGLVLVHCVEGGFHLLGDVTAAVDALADAGVAYITLAHLIFRGIATNANALPFLSDKAYSCVCRQRDDEGLTAAGREAVVAMHRRKVLIDVSHMNQASLDETFALLDELDAGQQTRTPVLATHGAVRKGKQHYNLAPETIEEIARRDGVIGLIMAQHQIWDGLGPAHFQPLFRLFERREDSFEKLAAHIDAIREITGSHRHVGIGSDMDGWIKPTLKGMKDMRDMAALETWLTERYGADAKLICSENALRPLLSYWQGA